ncbi:hypothetical protein LZ31DRAFT_375910 [Colletotrichum somersetense]|nr:hypothetical protein LZ31DRAFT_375910 [Colletotrichum somersetense]
MCPIHSTGPIQDFVGYRSTDDATRCCRESNTSRLERGRVPQGAIGFYLSFLSPPGTGMMCLATCHWILLTARTGNIVGRCNGVEPLVIRCTILQKRRITPRCQDDTPRPFDSNAGRQGRDGHLHRSPTNGAGRGSRPPSADTRLPLDHRRDGCRPENEQPHTVKTTWIAELSPMSVDARQALLPLSTSTTHDPLLGH